jgi:hypothetical protein
LNALRSVTLIDRPEFCFQIGWGLVTDLQISAG